MGFHVGCVPTQCPTLLAKRLPSYKTRSCLQQSMFVQAWIRVQVRAAPRKPNFSSIVLILIQTWSHICTSTSQHLLQRSPAVTGVNFAPRFCTTPYKGKDKAGLEHHGPVWPAETACRNATRSNRVQHVVVQKNVDRLLTAFNILHTNRLQSERSGRMFQAVWHVIIIVIERQVD